MSAATTAQTPAAAAAAVPKAQFDWRPLALLAAHGPYQDLRAAFFVGENDKTYGAWAKTLTQAAKARGVNATLTYAPGTGHDWHTAAYGVRESFPLLIARFGLPA